MADTVGMRLKVGVTDKTFKRAIGKYLSKFGTKNREEEGRKLFFRLLEKVIIKTPVDTGVARGGWGAGAEKLGITLPPGAGTDEGRSQSEYEEKRVSRFVLRISVTNRVNYIEFLEMGTSTQAPFGMVRISQRELEAELGTGRRLPTGILAVYQETWRALGFEDDTPLRAGAIAEALKLTPGLNVGAL